jgi:DNA-binding NtrC family response regulator
MVEERGHETAGETGSGHHPYTLLRLPDLSDRPEDIPEMAQQLALQICRELGRSVPPGGTALTDRFSRRLGGLKWPGQVPQLKSTLRNILAHAEELPLASAPGFEPTLDEIDGLDQAEPGAQRIAKPQEDLIPVAILDRLFDEIRHIQPLPPGLDLFDIVERHLIIRSLQLHHGNQSRAARQLGITRNTLRKRVAKYGFGLIP